MNNPVYCISGVHMFSRNLRASSKFQAPEGQYEGCSTMETYKYQASPYKPMSTGRPGIQYQCTPAAYTMIYDMIHLTAIGQFSTHIHTNNTENDTRQTIHRTTQKYIEQHKKYIEKHKNQEECGPCPVFAGFTLAFALQLRKKHGKPSAYIRPHAPTASVRTTVCWAKMVESINVSEETSASTFLVKLLYLRTMGKKCCAKPRD